MQLALLIDLNKCIGCEACSVACKQWNTSGSAGPLPDLDPYGADPTGVWFKHVYQFEAGEYPNVQTVYVPRNCFHCENAPCVPVCPVEATWKDPKDGIVHIDYDLCTGCKACMWACPYGAREFDPIAGVVKKCTLCVDRIYDQSLPEEERKPACVLTCPMHAHYFGDIHDPGSEISKLIQERGGFVLMPETGAFPASHYLPRRNMPLTPDVPGGGGVFNLTGGPGA